MVVYDTEIRFFNITAMKIAYLILQGAALAILVLAVSSNSLLAVEEAFALPEGKVNVMYEFQFETEGGLPPLKWKVAQGALPAGIELLPSGRLQGIPSTLQREPYKFVIEISDSSNPPEKILQPFTLVIRAAPLRLVLKPNKPPPKSQAQAAAPEPRVPMKESPPAATDLPRLAVPVQPSPSQPTPTADVPASGNVGNIKGREKKDTRLNPATFIRIYEDTKSGDHVLIYDPISSQGASQLAVDEGSKIVIVPDPERMDPDMPLNKLYMVAELASKDVRNTVQIEGYSEIGKDRATVEAQKGMAFQSARNIQAMVLNMAYTAYDLIEYVYDLTEKLEEYQAKESAADQVGKERIRREIERKIREGDAALNNEIGLLEREVAQGAVHRAPKPMLQRLESRVRLYRPEIKAIGDFFLEENNLALIEIIGTEIFWIDRSSLREIATNYRENLRIAFDDTSAPDAKAKALQDLLERTKLVNDDFEDLRVEIQKRMRDRMSLTHLSPLSNDERRLRRQQVIREYAEEMRKESLEKLKNLFAAGYISLLSNQARDGDMLTLRIEARGPEGQNSGIPAVFEITIKKYGLKRQLGSSLLFARRLGLKSSDLRPTDPNTRPLTEVNFAPAPGITYGLSFFKRGDSWSAKFLRALSPGLGMNVSFLNYNDPVFNRLTNQFTNEKGVNAQVGAGFIGTFFDNMLQVSYGWNLNASRKRSYFGLGFGFMEVGKEFSKYLKK